MRHPLSSGPVTITPTAVVHQEGVLGLIALVGITLRDRSPLVALAPLGNPIAGVVLGISVGAAIAGTLWLLRRIEPVRLLERWQRRLVSQWSLADALAVAVLSGLAEEALLRAFLQPIVGLIPAAVLFALLHAVPDRRLWFWPLMALVSGVALGLLFESFGFPAAAAAHVSLNAIGLARLRRPVGGAVEATSVEDA
jgi:membrane protease YdiL (CAAX protease family)